MQSIELIVTRLLVVVAAAALQRPARGAGYLRVADAV